MNYRLTIRSESQIVAEAQDNGAALSALRTAIDTVINKNGSSESQFVEAQAIFGKLNIELVRLPVGKAEGRNVGEAGIDNVNN